MVAVLGVRAAPYSVPAPWLCLWSRSWQMLPAGMEATELILSLLLQDLLLDVGCAVVVSFILQLLWAVVISDIFLNASSGIHVNTALFR